MREILFRGKTGKGEWIFGLLGCVYERPNEKYYFIHNCETDDTEYTVIPETVGQFTGLTANGKKIFEGDIVKFSHLAYEKTTIGHIDWEENEVGFVIRENERYHIIAYSSEFYEVIGNIHDNPELLEEFK